jgi:hypothetical protein
VGLEIEDPVAAFFNWCIERERIRSKREAGEPPPWTNDPVFQNGRFLNIFREDDKGTKAVLRFADAVKDIVSDLIHALFFARWCNQHTTLLTLEPHLLKIPKELRHALVNEVPQPWASEVYPVVPARWKGHAYDRLEARVRICSPRALQSSRSKDYGQDFSVFQFFFLKPDRYEKIQSGGFKYSSYLIHKGMDGSEEGAIKLFMQLRDKMMQIMTSLTFRLVEEVIEIIHNAGGKIIIAGE